MIESEDVKHIAWNELLMENILSNQQSINMCEANIYRDVPTLVTTALSNECMKQHKIFIGCLCVGQMEQLSQLIKECVVQTLGYQPKVQFFVSEDVGFNVNQDEQVAYVDMESVEQLYLYCESKKLSPFEFSVSQLRESQVVLFLQPLLTDARQACLNEYVHPDDVIVLCGSNMYVPDHLSSHLSERQLLQVQGLLQRSYEFCSQKDGFQDVYLEMEGRNSGKKAVNSGVGSHVRQMFYGGSRGLVGGGQSFRQKGDNFVTPDDDSRAPDGGRFSGGGPGQNDGFLTENKAFQAAAPATDQNFWRKSRIPLKDFLRQLLSIVSTLLNEIKEQESKKRESIQKHLQSLMQRKSKLLEEKKSQETRFQLSEHVDQQDKKRLNEINVLLNRVCAQIMELEEQFEAPTKVSVQDPQALAARLWLKENVDLQFLQTSSQFFHSFFQLLDDAGFVDSEIFSSLQESDESNIISSLFNQFPQLLQMQQGNSQNIVENNENWQIDNLKDEFGGHLSNNKAINNKRDKYTSKNGKYNIKNIQTLQLQIQNLQNELYDLHLKAFLQKLDDLVSISQFSETFSTLSDPNWKFVNRSKDSNYHFFSTTPTSFRIITLDFGAETSLQFQSTKLFQSREKVMQMQVLDFIIEFKEIAFYANKLIILVPFLGQTILQQAKAFFTRIPNKVFRSFHICEKEAIYMNFLGEKVIKSLKEEQKLVQRQKLALLQRSGQPLMDQSVKRRDFGKQSVQQMNVLQNNDDQEQVKMESSNLISLSYKYVGESTSFQAPLTSISFQNIKHYVLTTGADQSVLSMKAINATPEVTHNYVKLLQQLCSSVSDGIIAIFPSQKALDIFLRQCESSQQLNRIAGPKLLLVNGITGGNKDIWRAFVAAADAGRGALLLTTTSDLFTSPPLLEAQRCRLLVFAGLPMPDVTDSLVQGLLIHQHHSGVPIQKFLNETTEHNVRHIIQHIIPAPRAAVVYADIKFQQLFKNYIDNGTVTLATAGTERDIASFIAGG